MATTDDDINKWLESGSTKKLLKALENKNKDIRTAAVEALKQLKWNAEDDTQKAKYFIAANQFEKCLELKNKGIKELIMYLGHEDIYDDLVTIISKTGTEGLDVLLNTASFYATHYSSEVNGVVKSIVNESKEMFSSKERSYILLGSFKEALDLLIPAISSFGKDAIPVLMEKYSGTKDYFFRYVLIYSMGNIADPRTEDLLFEALNEKSSFLSSVFKGEQAANILSNSIIKAAAVALINIGSERVVGYFLSILNNPSDKLNNIDILLGSFEVAKSLREKGDPRAVDALISIVKFSQGTEIYEASIFELGETRSEKAIKPLIDVFTVVINAFKPELQEKPKEAAVEALTKIGEPAIVPLSDALENPHSKSTAENEWIKQYSARVLGLLKAKSAVDKLISALKDKPEIRAAAATALAETNDPQAVAPLIEALNDKYSVLTNIHQKTVCEALKKFNTEEAKKAVSLFESTKKKSKCFIATAVYGDPLAYEVNLFRSYRDEVLSQTLTGRLFIKIYYIVSPIIAEFIEGNEYLKRNVKRILDYVIFKYILK